MARTAAFTGCQVRDRAPQPSARTIPTALRVLSHRWLFAGSARGVVRVDPTDDTVTEVGKAELVDLPGRSLNPFSDAASP